MNYCPICMGQFGFWGTQVRGSTEGGCNFFNTQLYYPANALDRALDLIKNSVADEREDEMFYDYLISIAPSQKDKMIITSIRDDERKHNQMFRQLYCEITGVRLPIFEEEEFTPPRSFLDGIEKALFGELGAVERYRQILFGLTERHQINMITEIITDELKHALKYNFIYAENTR